MIISNATSINLGITFKISHKGNEREVYRKLLKK